MIRFTIYFLLLLYASSCAMLQPKACRNTALQDIEQIDDCLKGMTVQAALLRLNVDTAEVSTLNEPPFILRGVEFSQGDSCKVTLYVARTSVLPGTGIPYSHWSSTVLHKKIIGLSWRKPQAKKRAYIGQVIPHYEYR